MAFNEYENMHSTIRTVDQLLEDIQDLDRAVDQYQWANEKQGAFIRKVYERLGIFQDEEEDEGVNVDECFNKALSELDSRLSYFEGTSQKAIARSGRYAEWLNDIEAELFGERIETFTHGDHERQSERINDILVAAKNKASQMPKGVDWPRFTDGAPVLFGDKIDGLREEVQTIVLFSDGCFGIGDDLDTESCECFDSGTRINRQAPKVLAADGKPLRVGETIWRTGEVGTWEIMDIDASSGSVKVRRTDVENGPVVWSFRTFLNHERPDCWEWLWLDMHPADETECVGLDRDEFVRRAKAIAERGQ